MGSPGLQATDLGLEAVPPKPAAPGADAAGDAAGAGPPAISFDAVAEKPSEE